MDPKLRSMIRSAGDEFYAWNVSGYENRKLSELDDIAKYIKHVHFKLSLEDILKKASEMGYKGIEVIPAQMCPTYPFVSDEWIEKLKELLVKYDLEPVC